MPGLPDSEHPIKKICNSISELGEMPFEFSFLANRINEADLQSWLDAGATLIKQAEDPHQRYFSNWLWKELPAPTVQRGLGIKRQMSWVYWQDTAFFSGEHKASQFCQLEIEYLGQANQWVDQRLNLEKQLLNQSDDMRIFQRKLLTVLSSDEMNKQNIASEFVNCFWSATLWSLSRYFKAAEHGSYKVLTIQQHDDNVKAAKKLQKQVAKALYGIPPGFEPVYEKLFYQLNGFIEFDGTLVTPKRVHKKSARQQLIRELLLGWQQCAERTIKTVDPSVNGVKHVLTLVHAIGETDLPETDVYRENRKLQSYF